MLNDERDRAELKKQQLSKIKVDKVMRQSASRAQKITHKVAATISKTILPLSLLVAEKSLKTIDQKVVPAIQKGTEKAPKLMVEEVKKMHVQQHFWSRFQSTLVHKSLGLLLAMLSANIVENFFETRRINNLWGLASKKQLLSDEVFAVLLFSVEFFVALVVFTLTDHYYDRWKSGRVNPKTDA